MKKCYLLVILAVVSGFSCLQAQTLLAKWTFPAGTAADSIADGGTSANSNKAIRAIGTSSIDFSKNGNTTKAAQTTGWDNGSGTKYWQVTLSTTGFENIRLSSIQQSGGNNPGPRDFVVQCRISSDDNWTEVPGGTIVTANDWTTGALTDLVLPSYCNNAPEVNIRWLMNSNTNSSGNTVQANGISKIDDIHFYGENYTGLNPVMAWQSFQLYPNPVCNGSFTVETASTASLLMITDQAGRTVFSGCTEKTSVTISTAGWPKGLYIVRLAGRDQTIFKKLVVQ